jgi:hypothetical protein
MGIMDEFLDHSQKGIDNGGTKCSIIRAVVWGRWWRGRREDLALLQFLKVSGDTRAKLRVLLILAHCPSLTKVLA